MPKQSSTPFIAVFFSVSHYSRALQQKACDSPIEGEKSFINYLTAKCTTETECQRAAHGAEKPNAESEAEQAEESTAGQLITQRSIYLEAREQECDSELRSSHLRNNIWAQNTCPLWQKRSSSLSKGAKVWCITCCGCRWRWSWAFSQEPVTV